MRNIYCLLFIFITMLSGCKFAKQVELPEQQFVFITKNVEIYLCSESNGECVKYEDGHGYASGFLVGHSIKDRYYKSYYLTAGHVCTLHSSMEFNNDIFAKVETKEIHLLDYDGEDILAKVVAVDVENDICLLETQKVNHIPVVIEKRRKIKKQTRVINVAAPNRVWNKDMMLHFEGTYQGEHKNKSVYVLEAQPGSSGSPIFDPTTGRVVGMITHVMGPSYSVSYGPTLKQINDFLDENLPKE